MSEGRPLPTEDHRNAMREGVRALVSKVWGRLLAGRGQDGQFPHKFHRTMAKGGWLGITMLEEIEGKTGKRLIRF